MTDAELMEMYNRIDADMKAVRALKPKPGRAKKTEVTVDNIIEHASQGATSIALLAESMGVSNSLICQRMASYPESREYIASVLRQNRAAKRGRIT